MSRSCGAEALCRSEAARKFFCNLVIFNHALIQIQSSILIWFVSIMWCIDWITWQGICQDVTHTHTHRKRNRERENATLQMGKLSGRCDITSISPPSVASVPLYLCSRAVRTDISTASEKAALWFISTTLWWCQHRGALAKEHRPIQHSILAQVFPQHCPMHRLIWQWTALTSLNPFKHRVG